MRLRPSRPTTGEISGSRRGLKALLAYGVKNPNEQRQYPIVGLGSFAGVLDSRYVPYRYGRGAGRGLDLLWWDVVWYGHYRFLALRELSSLHLSF